MKWAITGTPGTGKTTVASSLDRPVVHLNELVEEGGFRTGRDDDRETAIADIDGLETWLAEQPADVVVESHLAHLLPVDRVIVLRCDPTELRERLVSRTDEQTPSAKIDENVESERLDVVLVEAIERHGTDNVYEIDTTDTPVETVAQAVEDALSGRRDPSVGTVSFLEDE